MLYWDETLATGITVVDEDHRGLFGLIKVIDEAKHSDVTGDKVCAAIEALNDYAHDHFRREEALMLLSGYTARSRQEDEHKSFSITMRRLLQLYQVSPNLVSISGVVLYLTDWLRGHIAYSDQAYVSSMRECGQLIDIASQNLLNNIDLNF